MDGITGPTANPVDDVNRILQIATSETIDQSKKLMRLAVETSVGCETGKGAAVDVSA